MPAADDDDGESEGREEEMIDDFFFDEGIFPVACRSQSSIKARQVSLHKLGSRGGLFIMIIWHESAGYI